MDNFVVFMPYAEWLQIIASIIQLLEYPKQQE